MRHDVVAIRGVGGQDALVSDEVEARRRRQGQRVFLPIPMARLDKPFGLPQRQLEQFTHRGGLAENSPQV